MPSIVGRFLSLLLLRWASFTHALHPHYLEARRIRIEQGAAAAAPLYRRLLRENSSDGTAATRLAAAGAETRTRLAQVGRDTTPAHSLRRVLLEAGYTAERVHAALGVPPELGRHCVAPLCAAPAAAGTVTRLPWTGDDGSSTMAPPTAVDCLTALFLLGLAVPCADLEATLSSEQVRVLVDAHVVATCELQPDKVFGLVQIFPLSLGDIVLYLLTDWHPKVLSQTTIDGGEGAVMYIGPDSLALVQHYLMMDDDDDDNAEVVSSQPGPSARHLLDLCTGSGVQALAALTLGRCHSAVALDVNPRCLRFARFNAALNGLQDRLMLVQCDLLGGTGCVWDEVSPKSPQSRPLEDLLRELSPTRQFHVITANPPFLPVPPGVPDYRHGLFSAGGTSGEAVLARVVRLAGKLLAPAGGTLAVVSEFFLAGPAADGGPLRRRLAAWFRPRATLGRGLLLTNAAPIDSATYADRRAAGSAAERRVWRDHLESKGIGAASPGLLYLRRCMDDADSSTTVIEHILVPRSRQGSIWSPYNKEAINFTRSTFIQHLVTLE